MRPLILTLGWILVLVPFVADASKSNEKTYSITLTKTAGADHDVYRVGNRKVLADVHEVKKGEYLWKIMRDKGLLKRADFPALFKALKELNKSFKNLDLIHPGDKILIPLKITPVEGVAPTKVAKVVETKVTPAQLKDLKLDHYTVAPGDNIVKVVTSRYDIPASQLYGQYMDMVKKLNPHIRDINRIYPGQVIKLPIFSPKVVRKPIERPPPKEPTTKAPRRTTGLNPHAQELRAIFEAIGEEWVQSGEHFIPLRSGGQIDLKATSFPLINLTNGARIIVDLGNKLPPRMASLIENTWGSYRVVHLLPSDDLPTALEKILSRCGYVKVLRRGESVVMERGVRLQLKGDWIVERGAAPSGNGWSTAVINIISDDSERTVPSLVRYLQGLGVQVVDFPLLSPAKKSTGHEKAFLSISDLKTLSRVLVDMAGIKYSTGVEIPVYGKKEADFNLIIMADIFFSHQGKDCIIDLGSLDKTLISFLEKHRFKVLSLSGKKGPLERIEEILGFLGYPFERGFHPFWGSTRDPSRNIKIEIPGVIFADVSAQKVLATTVPITPELASFLWSHGFKALSLAIR